LNKYCGQHKYSGYVNLLPFRRFPAPEECRSHLEVAIHSIREAQRLDEIQSLFSSIPRGNGIVDSAEGILSSITSALERIEVAEAYCHCESLSAYNVSAREREDIESFRLRQPQVESPVEDADLSSRCRWFSAHTTISVALGVVFGRWDIRIALDPSLAPKLPDPFAPLPACPPGMLQNADGRPAEPKDVPPDYPLRISWPGILVGDENHPEDIVTRVRGALEVIWKGRADAIEHEASELLGVKNLRDYFRRPAGFFADHLKRYSKSRRQAPIYWPLSTAKGSYTLWIYYHRLTDQTPHTVLADFVDPKLKSVRSEISALRESDTHRNRLEELLDLERELADFHTEIERIIKLPWKPNLNDGVLITASPLWKLFHLPKWQKDLKACWEKLEKGEYDWSHLAYSIWPKRVEEVCKKERSIAIAHGLEAICKTENPKPKKTRNRRQSNGGA
jgi:hypothetical protein